MRDTTGMAVALGLMALLGGCGEAEPGEPGECTLPSDPTFQITEAQLQTDLSNSACPEFDAADLDQQLLAADACEQTIDDCAVLLACEVDSFIVEGKLKEKSGQLSGRIDLRSPLVCVYFVTAELL